MSFPDQVPDLVVAVLYKVKVNVYNALDMIIMTITHGDFQLLELCQQAFFRKVNMTFYQTIQIFITPCRTVFFGYGVRPYWLRKLCIRY